MTREYDMRHKCTSTALGRSVGGIQIDGHVQADDKGGSTATSCVQKGPSRMIASFSQGTARSFDPLIRLRPGHKSTIKKVLSQFAAIRHSSPVTQNPRTGEPGGSLCTTCYDAALISSGS